MKAYKLSVGISPNQLELCLAIVPEEIIKQSIAQNEEMRSVLQTYNHSSVFGFAWVYFRPDTAAKKPLRILSSQKFHGIGEGSKTTGWFEGYFGEPIPSTNYTIHDRVICKVEKGNPYNLEFPSTSNPQTTSIEEFLSKHLDSFKDRDSAFYRIMAFLHSTIGSPVVPYQTIEDNATIMEREFETIVDDNLGKSKTETTKDETDPELIFGIWLDDLWQHEPDVQLDMPAFINRVLDETTLTERELIDILGITWSTLKLYRNGSRIGHHVARRIFEKFPVLENNLDIVIYQNPAHV